MKTIFAVLVTLGLGQATFATQARCGEQAAKAVHDLILKQQGVEVEAKAFFVDYVSLHTKQYDVFTTFVTESEPFGANYQVDVVEYDLLHHGECPIVRIKKQAR